MKRNALLSSTSVSLGTLACTGRFALAFSVLLLLLRFLTPNLFWHLFTPVFRIADAFSTESRLFFNSFGDTAELASQNEILSNKNTVLANENQALLKKETDLEAILGSPATVGNSVSGISAGVVTRPPESPYDTLVIAEGSRAGIARGQEVFGNGGVPIGVVSSVLTDFSHVTLFSSPNMTITGFVGKSNISFLITGAGAGALQASIARSANVAVGDIVFVPGPGMLPIGSITRIDDDPSSPSMTLRIMPALNLFSISWVVVRETGTTLFDAFLHASSTSSLP